MWDNDVIIVCLFGLSRAAVVYMWEALSCFFLTFKQRGPSPPSLYPLSPPLLSLRSLSLSLSPSPSVTENYFCLIREKARKKVNQIPRFDVLLFLLLKNLNPCQTPESIFLLQTFPKISKNRTSEI